MVCYHFTILPSLVIWPKLFMRHIIIMRVRLRVLFCIALLRLDKQRGRQTATKRPRRHEYAFLLRVLDARRDDRATLIGDEIPRITPPPPRGRKKAPQKQPSTLLFVHTRRWKRRRVVCLAARCWLSVSVFGLCDVILYVYIRQWIKLNNPPVLAVIEHAAYVDVYTNTQSTNHTNTTYTRRCSTKKKLYICIGEPNGYCCRHLVYLSINGKLQTQGIYWLNIQTKMQSLIPNMKCTL